MDEAKRMKKEVVMFKVNFGGKAYESIELEVSGLCHGENGISW